MFEQREGLIKSDGMERSRYVGVLPRKKKISVRRKRCILFALLLMGQLFKDFFPSVLHDY